MWTELPEDADVSGGVRSENGGLPAQPAVIKEYGRFAYLEGTFPAQEVYQETNVVACHMPQLMSQCVISHSVFFIISMWSELRIQKPDLSNKTMKSKATMQK